MEKINPPHLVAHLHFLQPHKSKQKIAKELPSLPTGDTANIDTLVLRTERRAAGNTGLAKVAVQCSAVRQLAEVNHPPAGGLRINPDSYRNDENRHLLAVAKRYRQEY